MGMSSTSAYQMARLQQSGMVYQTALKELSRITGKSEATLQTAFEHAGVKSMAFDDRVYRAAGLSPLPLNLSPAMLNVLMAGLDKTGWTMFNLTRTTALSAQRAFVDAADQAYLKVTTGAFSYDQAIRAAVKNVAAQGLSTIEYASGRTEQLDVSMRRTVLTGVAQTTGQVQIARMDEMGTDLVQTSAHSGSRPEHEVWQGKIFSLSGTSDKYPDFVSSTGYSEVDGLCGINCRHSFYPFFEGLSENAYSQADVSDMNNATVTLPNGDQISQYAASQRQREIERNIRAWKRQRDALDAASLDSTAETAKVKDWQSAMREFITSTGLNRQRVREQI